MPYERRRMIDIWVKFVSDQFEIALNMTRAVFGLGAMEAPVPVHKDHAEAIAPDRADAVAANPMDEPQKTGREEERFAAVVPEAETTRGRPHRSPAASPGRCRSARLRAKPVVLDLKPP